MCTRIFILLLVCSAWVVSAREPAAPHWIRSRSGQFLVESWTPEVRPKLSTTGSVQRVRLEPMTLAVWCDRIRDTLLEELRWPDQWATAIAVAIRPHASTEDPVRIVAVRYTDAWSYRVELPPEVTEQRLLRAIVEVLLRERVNRAAGFRAAEVPLWLVEGISEHLRARFLGRLALDRNSYEFGHVRRGEQLEQAHKLFQSQRPLSLERLSWPTEADIQGEGADLYRACAQVLVHELLRLPAGHGSLERMVEFLPKYLNWQMAFLASFSGQFPDFTRFDKWWSLVAVHHGGHPDRFYWSAAQSLHQLGEILTVPLEVRLKVDQLPMLTGANLQKILLEWDYRSQEALLAQRVNHLQALVLRCPPPQAALVTGYLQAIDRYMRARLESLSPPAPRTPTFQSPRQITLQTIARLDQLDEERRGQLLRHTTQLQR